MRGDDDPFPRAYGQHERLEGRRITASSTDDNRAHCPQSGAEMILARRTVPALPTALRNVWISMWSKRDSRLRRLRAARHASIAAAHSASCQAKVTA